MLAAHFVIKEELALADSKEKKEEFVVSSVREQKGARIL